MAAQLYTVVGDTNVRRNMTTMNVASRVAMTNAKVIDCLTLSRFAETLNSVSADTTVCIVQCLTSFLVACQDTGSIFGTIDPALAEFAEVLRQYCASRPTLSVSVAPPLYRSSPSWYRTSLPQIAQQFSTVLTSKQPRNLHLLASHVSQDLCPDGVHLTPVSGLHYVLHLFDDTQRVLNSSAASGV